MNNKSHDAKSYGYNLPVLPPGYEYVKEISAGNYGTVWLVSNTNVNRYEAIKILHRFGSVEFQRFCQEIETIATLNHPNIVTIFYAKPDEMYFIMEYLEVSLHTLLQKKNFSTLEGIKFLMQVAKGLDFAHDKGLVHRDLKPGNILFSPEMVPKIADFGLVKNIDFTDPDKQQITGGLPVGTPRYMAPEQWEGPRIDHRCDIWAIGVMTYEILTRQAPFNHLSGIQLANAVMNTAIPSPHKVASLSLWEQLIEPICMKALERDPSKRYQSAYELGKALEKALTIDDETQEHRSPNPFTVTATRPQMSPKKTKISRIYGIATALILLILFGGTFFIYEKAHKAGYMVGREKEEKTFKQEKQTLQKQIEQFQKQIEQQKSQLKQLKKEQKLLLQKTEKIEKEKGLLAKKITNLEKKLREQHSSEEVIVDKTKIYRERINKYQIQLQEQSKVLSDWEQKLEDYQIQGKNWEKEKLFYKQSLQSKERKKEALSQETERLLPFENSFYKITLVGSQESISKIEDLLKNKGFYMRRSVPIKKEKNICYFFTRKNPIPTTLQKKVDYLIDVLSPHIGEIQTRRIESNNEQEIKIELGN